MDDDNQREGVSEIKVNPVDTIYGKARIAEMILDNPMQQKLLEIRRKAQRDLCVDFAKELEAWSGAEFTQGNNIEAFDKILDNFLDMRDKRND